MKRTQSAVYLIRDSVTLLLTMTGWWLPMALIAGVPEARITMQPQSITVDVGQAATFSIGVETLPLANDFSVQWFMDGVVIPEANETTFRGNATLGLNGASFQAKVNTMVGEVISEVATLTVDPDTTPPTAIAAQLFDNGIFGEFTRVGILFDEPLDFIRASELSSWNIVGNSIFNARPAGNMVELTFLQAPAVGSNLQFSRIADEFGNFSDGSVVIEEISGAVFESFNVPYQNTMTLLGAARFSGGGGSDGDGYLSLTDDVNDRRGTVIFEPSIIGAAFNDFVLGGRLRLGGSSSLPADGLSINLVRSWDPLLNPPDGNGYAGSPDGMFTNQCRRGISDRARNWL